MTSHRRNARTCRLLALALAAGATWMATGQHWIPAVCLAYVAAFLVYVGGREAQFHRYAVARHEQERRAVSGDAVVISLPVPCCQFWRHSDGAVHGPDCTRPAAARVADKGPA